MNRSRFLATALLSPAAVFANSNTKRTRTIKGFKVAAGESHAGEHWTMRGVTLNRLDLKIGAADTDGAMAVFEQTGLTPNGGPPLHVHPLQDEWFYVVEGQYKFQVGDDTFALQAGDTIFMPRAVPHAFIQLTEKGKMVVTYQPAGKMEQFFKTTAAWKTPPTKEEITAVFEACEMKVVGPPLKRD